MKCVLEQILQYVATDDKQRTISILLPPPESGSSSGLNHSRILPDSAASDLQSVSNAVVKACKALQIKLSDNTMYGNKLFYICGMTFTTLVKITL